MLTIEVIRLAHERVQLTVLDAFLQRTIAELGGPGIVLELIQKLERLVSKRSLSFMVFLFAFLPTFFSAID